jgi:hypothetical protein
VTLTREVKEMVIKIQGYYAYVHGETFTEGAIIGMLCEKELEKIRKDQEPEMTAPTKDSNGK